MVNFIIRQFAGKIAAVVASLIAIAIIHGFAWLAAQCPQIAALCNPQAAATWVDTVVIAAFNILANKYHMDSATVQTVADALKATPPEVVMQAEPVTKP